VKIMMCQDCHILLFQLWGTAMALCQGTSCCICISCLLAVLKTNQYYCINCRPWCVSMMVTSAD
jgi:hypothetical protein